MRFPGFSEEWEKHRIGEFCSFFSGGTPSSSKKEYYGGKISFIRSGEIHSDDTELFLSEEGYKNSSAKMVEVGDILLALYGANSGDIAISKIHGAINQAILCIRTNMVSVFFKSVWEKHTQKILDTYLQGGQGNLSAEIVKKIFIHLPAYDEQLKLAAFISKLEERIAIQNKVIEDLITLEKVFINSSFRDIKGENIPLSVISQRIVDRNANCGCSNVLTISAKDGLVSQLNYFKKSVASQNLSNYYLLQKGDFAYNKSYSTDYPWGAVKHLENYNQGILSPLYFCFRANSRVVNIDYLQLFFDTDIWYKHISEIAVEGARNHGLLNMSVSDFMAMPILLPSLVEQNKIVNNLMYFRKKKQCEIQYLMALEKQKKYLLGQMFI